MRTSQAAAQRLVGVSRRDRDLKPTSLEAEGLLVQLEGVTLY